MSYQGPAEIVITGTQVAVTAKLWPSNGDDDPDNLTTDGTPSTWRGILSTDGQPFRAELGQVFALQLPDGAAGRARVRMRLADTANQPGDIDMVAVIGDGPAPWDEEAPA